MILDKISLCLLMATLARGQQETRNVDIQNLNNAKDYPRNCYELQQLEKRKGFPVSGIKSVYPFKESPTWAIDVYCDQDIEDGGWTVFQTRNSDMEPRVDFNRSWVEYTIGFGSLEGEFWLGLDNIHALSSHVLMELMIELENSVGVGKNARYGVFSVANQEQMYRLTVDDYLDVSTVGDSFAKSHNGMNFSTVDKDNDRTSKVHCALAYKGAWWYNDCHTSNLNGYYHFGNHKSSPATGINWYEFGGYEDSMKLSKMMMRPAFRKDEN